MALSKTLTLVFKSSGLGSTLKGVAGLVTGITLLKTTIFDSITTARDFEVILKRIEAVSGSNASQMGTFEHAIKSFSKNSIFGLQETGRAALEFVKIGYSTVDVVYALDDAINLATAGEATLEESINLTARTLKQFNYNVAEASRVTDVIAKAANESAADVADFGKALQYVGPYARSLNYEIEDTAAILAVMSNAGLESTIAARNLRMAFTRMVNPTAEASALLERYEIDLYDSNEQMKSWADIIDEIANKFAGLTDQQKKHHLAVLDGVRGINAMLIPMIQGTDELRRMNDALYDSEGYAEAASDKMRESLNYQMKELSHNVQAVREDIGDGFIPVLIQLTSQLDEVISRIGAVNRAFGEPGGLGIIKKRTDFFLTGLDGLDRGLAAIIAAPTFVTSPLTGMTAKQVTAFRDAFFNEKGGFFGGIASTIWNESGAIKDIYAGADPNFYLEGGFPMPAVVAREAGLAGKLPGGAMSGSHIDTRFDLGKRAGVQPYEALTMSHAELSSKVADKNSMNLVTEKEMKEMEATNFQRERVTKLLERQYSTMYQTILSEKGVQAAEDFRAKSERRIAWLQTEFAENELAPLIAQYDENLRVLDSVNDDFAAAEEAVKNYTTQLDKISLNIKRAQLGMMTDEGDSSGWSDTTRKEYVDEQKQFQQTVGERLAEANDFLDSQDEHLFNIEDYNKTTDENTKKISDVLTGESGGYARPSDAVLRNLGIDPEKYIDPDTYTERYLTPRSGVMGYSTSTRGLGGEEGYPDVESRLEIGFTDDAGEMFTGKVADTARKQEMVS